MQRVWGFLTIVLLAGLFGMACGGGGAKSGQEAASPAATTATGAQPAASGTATASFPTAQEKASYQQMKSQFDSQIVPAAKKEGQLNWYTCQTTEDAQAIMAAFNKAYPEIKVNYVYMQPGEAFQRITAEEASNHVLGDNYLCGGTTSRNLDFNGAVDPYVPPSAVATNAAFSWDAVDTSGHYPICCLDLAGLQVNTKLVPQSHYPKTWWDVVQDPYWQDLIKKGLVAIGDPRQPGHGRGGLYGLVVKHPDDYGWKFAEALAALKPKRIAVESGEAARGEVNAFAFTTLRQQLVTSHAPVTLLCPDPGCEATSFTPEVLKGAQHPNAARVFSDFLLSKPGLTVMAQRGFTVADPSIPSDPNRSFKTHPPTYWPDDAAAKDGAAFQKDLNNRKLFDYP